MGLRSAVVAVIFLFLSGLPTYVLVEALPSRLQLLWIPIMGIVAFGSVRAHEREQGTLGDAGAYFFWVYAVAIPLAVVSQTIEETYGVSLVTVSNSVLFADAAFVLAAYASAWWLVYRDGWARIRPLNWGESRTDAASEE